ncbi:hypothetical protein FMEAI12_2680020 [Parafrankia sp. Ea1.12]|nr:hypothetical protein FMEAI12_2680020 [Parafrankia sp. Ea1.12]
MEPQHPDRPGDGRPYAQAAQRLHLVPEGGQGHPRLTRPAPGSRHSDLTGRHRGGL